MWCSVEQAESWADAIGFSRGRQRASAFALVALVHLVALWTIFSNLHMPANLDGRREFDVTVFAPSITPNRPSEPEWKFKAPENVIVPEPEINILPDNSEPSISAAPSNQVIPPRADPDHINAAPELPLELRSAARGAAVILRILVQPNGLVSDALLVKGSSNPKLDRIAIQYVQDNWRFTAAMAAGTPIRYWTTIRVAFGS